MSTPIRVLAAIPLCIAAVAFARPGPGDTPPAGLGLATNGTAAEVGQSAGKVTVVTFWASWCAPCRKELPMLEGLQRAAKDRVQVVAVNIDTRDSEKPKNFWKEINLTRLGYFSDPKAKVFQELKTIGRALGMPTSVLVDGDGCEIATIAGPAEWDSDDAIKLITAAVKPAD